MKIPIFRTFSHRNYHFNPTAQKSNTSKTMATQLKVKLMSGEEFFIHVELSASVVDAKAAVKAAQNYNADTTLKLICDGKVLSEAEKVVKPTKKIEKVKVVAENKNVEAKVSTKKIETKAASK